MSRRIELAKKLVDQVLGMKCEESRKGHHYTHFFWNMEDVSMTKHRWVRERVEKKLQDNGFRMFPYPSKVFVRVEDRSPLSGIRVVVAVSNE